MVAGLEEPTDGRDPHRRRGHHRTPSRTSGRSTRSSRTTRCSRTWTSSRTSRSACAGAAAKSVKSRSSEALELVELAGTWPGASRRSSPAASSSASRWPGRSSTGPAVLLLDEPLGALDLKLRRQMQIELKRIQTEVGLTFVHVTHDQEEAMTMADTIAVMNAGRIEQLGAPAELYEAPDDDLRRELPRPVEPGPGRASPGRTATTWCSTCTAQKLAMPAARRHERRPTTCSSASGRRRSSCAPAGRARRTEGPQRPARAASSPTPASPA